jgi:hypothetical protein
VSLLSPKVRVALTPGRVAVADGRNVREAEVAAPGWAGAVEALSGLLAGAGLSGRASVTLSHHFAPVHLLTSPAVALKPLEMQGWIRDTLAKQFGEAGRGWQVAWQPEPPGRSFIASSFDPAQLAELEGVLRAASIQPSAVQPWLAASWNRQRRRFGRGRAWYALAEPGRLTLLGLESGRVKSLRSSLFQADAVNALADLLTRETLLAGEAVPAPLWVESAVLRPNWQELGGGRSVHPLPQGREALAALLGN